MPILVKDKVEGYTLTDIILTLALNGKPAPGESSNAEIFSNK